MSAVGFEDEPCAGLAVLKFLPEAEETAAFSAPGRVREGGCQGQPGPTPTYDRKSHGRRAWVSDPRRQRGLPQQIVDSSAVGWSEDDGGTPRPSQGMLKRTEDAVVDQASVRVTLDDALRVGLLVSGPQCKARRRGYGYGASQVSP